MHYSIIWTNNIQCMTMTIGLIKNREGDFVEIIFVLFFLLILLYRFKLWYFRCQFSEYGCDYRDYLCHLVKHEFSCPDRSITCPPPNGCLEKIQLKQYHKHAVQQVTLFFSFFIFIGLLNLLFHNCQSWPRVYRNESYFSIDSYLLICSIDHANWLTTWL